MSHSHTSSTTVTSDSTTKTCVQTTCAYCGVGCGISATVDADARVVQVKGDDQHPANRGRLCSKGSSLGETLGLDSRLLAPEVNGETVSWDRALDAVANGFQSVIDRHGPDAVAIYGSGQLLTEDYYVANKLMKGFIGSANIDTNSRLCMSSAVAGHKRAFGTDTVAACYADLDQAQLIVLTGSNTAWCHPIVFQRIQAAREKNPLLKVVVIDPRRTATCDIADLHLPLTSGSDVKLFNGLLYYLASSGAVDWNYIARATEGFEAAVNAAGKDAGELSAVARTCGLPEKDVETFYRWFAETEKTMVVYSQGVKQSSSGADKVNAIINCHLATGRIGKPGAGPLSLTGQPNAMGGREVGGLANQLAAHLDFEHPGDGERLARFWQTDKLVSKPGLPAVEMFDAVADGKIKAIWIMATNPVVSLPNADKVKAALKACELVVVSDCVAETDTLALADIKLPALGWSEKDGMVTNSERCISRQRALLPPAGAAKPDWWIISQLARRLGYGHAFDYRHPVEIFREHAALSGFENSHRERLRDFDISALAEISLDAYDNFQSTQWPINKRFPDGRARFFDDEKFYTHSGRARFVPLTARAPGHATDKRFPLVLNTGRLRDQWHTMTRSALAPRLNQHRPEPFVEVHPQDAACYQLRDGGIAHLLSRWGQMYARVMVTEDQQPGNLFVPMHWSEQYATKGRMGALVNPVVDPLSGQPESKHTPVAIRPFNAGWYGFVLSRTPLEALNVEYQVTVNAEGYYRYELAAMQSRADWCAWSKRLLLSTRAALQWQEYEDAASGVFRAATFNGDRLQALICIAPTFDTPLLPGRGWLGSVFGKERLPDHERVALLAGLPTAGAEDMGATVCACFNVGEKTLVKAIQTRGLTSYQQVGECCKAGTNCGSCVPEIKKLLVEAAVTSAA